MAHWFGRGSDLAFIAKMPKQLGGCQFYCSLRDEISREVFFAGTYDPQESAFLRDILCPGMTFVDVGANWGLFTLMAAQLVGKEGRVLAIEADPRVFQELKSNVEYNQLPQIQIVDVAVADREGQMVLAGHDESSSNHGVSRLVSEGSSTATKFTVRSRPLDSVLDDAGVDAVDLLKIDVEGAEDMVLAGMEDGLKSGRYQRVLLEVHPALLAERGRALPEIMDAMTTHGYSGWALDYSAEMVRKAYYHPALHSSNFLLPMELATVEQGRHTIWLLPGQTLLTK